MTRKTAQPKEMGIPQLRISQVINSESYGWFTMVQYWLSIVNIKQMFWEYPHFKKPRQLFAGETSIPMLKTMATSAVWWWFPLSETHAIQGYVSEISSLYTPDIFRSNNIGHDHDQTSKPTAAQPVPLWFHQNKHAHKHAQLLHTHTYRLIQNQKNVSAK